MLPKRRAIALALVIGSIVGGTGGATILMATAEPHPDGVHVESTLQPPQPGSSSAT